MIEASTLFTSRISTRIKRSFTVFALATLCVTGPKVVHAAQEQAALSSPGLDESTDSDAVNIPSVLSSRDAELYRQIFKVQESGRWKDADNLISRLADDVLMGHVLAQRYLHPTAYRSRFAELRDWLAKYADLPEAPRIYKLAMTRRGSAAKPKSPVGSFLKGAGYDYEDIRPYYHKSNKGLSSAQRSRVSVLKRRIHSRIRSGWPSGALDVLDSGEAQHLFDAYEQDQARAAIASGYYYFGKPDLALKHAAKAAKRSGKYLPEALWVAGLTAWRLNKFDEAHQQFDDVSTNQYASSWTRSAGAFWAARIDLAQGKFDRADKLLNRAAKYPRSFYGLLALRALGRDDVFDWDSLSLTQDRANKLRLDPIGRRALALLQIGNRHEAEQEMRKAAISNDPSLRRAILSLADTESFAALTMRLGNYIAQKSGEVIVNALYPVPSWVPEGGYNVDRALIYALMRQESGFNAEARSHVGARGLMQLMPATASYIGNTRYRGAKRAELYEPEVNIGLGQKYVGHLLDQDGVDNGFLQLMAAYNGGIGNLGRWQKALKDNEDPLYFIESIPSRETRLFIERVMANLWMYRSRLGQDRPSLDRLAAGKWPVYQSQDADGLASVQ
ncbi:lytic transglycosylase domain-containing protein [Thalassospira marina]|uniref:Transglycosylase n=1 Tax=Thalassospira marina TaxID=2048283 RepID=A0A2N3KUF6_9PROT|nr:lytic transglycosylase domain-containing protein [Thalassospira marina]PKR54201.1 transglycosylase [Thalassospira marina]